MSENRLEKILQFFNEDPENPFLLYALALEYQSIQKWDLAIQSFERLRMENPSYLGLYFPLSQLYFNLGKKALSLIRIEEGIKMSTLQNHAKTLAELLELKESILDFEN